MEYKFKEISKETEGQKADLAEAQAPGTRGVAHGG